MSKKAFDEATKAIHIANIFKMNQIRKKLACFQVQDQLEKMDMKLFSIDSQQIKFNSVRKRDNKTSNVKEGLIKTNPLKKTKKKGPKLEINLSRSRSSNQDKNLKQSEEQSYNINEEDHLQRTQNQIIITSQNTDEFLNLLGHKQLVSKLTPKRSCENQPIDQINTANLSIESDENAKSNKQQRRISVKVGSVIKQSRYDEKKVMQQWQSKVRQEITSQKFQKTPKNLIAVHHSSKDTLQHSAIPQQEQRNSNLIQISSKDLKSKYINEQKDDRKSQKQTSRKQDKIQKEEDDEQAMQREKQERRKKIIKQLEKRSGHNKYIRSILLYEYENQK